MIGSLMKATEIVKILNEMITSHEDGDVQLELSPDEDTVCYAPVYDVTFNRDRLYPYLFSGTGAPNRNSGKCPYCNSGGL